MATVQPCNKVRLVEHLLGGIEQIAGGSGKKLSGGGVAPVSPVTGPTCRRFQVVD